MCMLSGFPELGRRMYSMGRSSILDGLGYNGVSRLDRLEENRKSTLVSPDKVVLKLDEQEQKGR